jgi:hypothetical protein
MDAGFFIAQKQEDGTPGRPVGNDDGSIAVFEELDTALKVRDALTAEHGKLSVFKINISFAGEFLA